MPDVLKCKWRIGRKVGRTIYAMIDILASDDDILIGMMDSYELSVNVVESHNATL